MEDGAVVIQTWCHTCVVEVVARGGGAGVSDEAEVGGVEHNDRLGCSAAATKSLAFLC